jgi:hypothetical protein
LTEEISKAISTGLTFADACSLVGISETSFYTWRRKGDAELKRRGAKAAKSDPNAEPYVQFTQSIKGAIPRRKRKLLNMIYKHAEIEWVAAAWLLERMHPDEFSLVQKVRTELTGKDGGAVKVQNGIAPEVRAALDKIYGGGGE